MGVPIATLYAFLAGASFCGAWVSGLYFFKFWTRTRDRLFLFFGVAFWTLALERLIIIFVNDPGSETEDHPSVYLIRLLAFVLILFAIIDKNRQAKKPLA